MKLEELDQNLLHTVSDFKDIPTGAVNIRKDGKPIYRHSSPNIEIKTGEGGGLVVEIKPGTKNETVHAPVILTQTGIEDKVFNQFIVGENADVTIIAGCGIHNDSHGRSSHEGLHEIIVKEGARLKYVEKHYGEGGGTGEKVFYPTTRIEVMKNAVVEIETVQIEGVDDTVRVTEAHIHEKGSLKVMERLMTSGRQNAVSDIKIFIEGQGGSGQILSRSVGKDNSTQVFKAALVGRNECQGHVECDSIIMGQAVIKAVPELIAEDSEAVLTHEAAIGKIAGEQLIKLMTLGLTEEQAIDTILEGFLK